MDLTGIQQNAERMKTVRHVRTLNKKKPKVTTITSAQIIWAQKIAKVISAQMTTGQKIDILKTGHNLGYNTKQIKTMVQLPRFTDYLDRYGVSDDRIAEILRDKLEEHAALPAGRDWDTFKILDMIMKTKGLYKAEQKQLDEEPESIRMIKDALSGAYIAPEEEVQDD